MAIRTENLTILFVDIAGFTVTTSRQSRAENAHLLSSFERTLRPMVKAYKGTLVKSIGDAQLLTFRSPTDAMLCAMALQDAMHGYNLSQSEENKIRIRVAASLGEVRVTNKDIFGEPVNVSARIEGITPGDEIYLSEAVYLAMNKAEVPAEEVGFRELSGIAQAIRIYSIPRFATRRLVSEKTPTEETGSAILYPYGGMHQRIALSPYSFQAGWRRSVPKLLLLGLAGLALGLGLTWLNSTPSTKPVAPQPLAAANPQALAAAPGMGAQDKPAMAASSTSTPANPATANADQTTAQKPVAATSTPLVPGSTIPTPLPATSTPAKPTAVAPAPSKSVAAKPQVATSKPTPVASPTPSGATHATNSENPVTAGHWSITSAKLAYRAGRLSKAEYREVARQLEIEYDNKIRQLKLDYRAGKITRDEYEQRVTAAKLAYKSG